MKGIILACLLAAFAVLVLYFVPFLNAVTSATILIVSVVLGVLILKYTNKQK